MIHYHGTPLTPRSELSLMAGHHFCVSFADPRDLEQCLRIGQSLMLDNGAFTAFTQGKHFAPETFYEWLDPILAPPHWAIVPDVIGGSVEQQRELAKSWPHRRDLGAPVWHLNLPIDYLLELCDGWPRVCLGSSAEYWKVGSPIWQRRMDEVFDALTKTFGRIPWIHGLRMLGQSNGPWPLASADSVNVARNYKDMNACPNCMARKINATNPPTRWRGQLQGELL